MRIPRNAIGLTAAAVLVLTGCQGESPQETDTPTVAATSDVPAETGEPETTTPDAEPPGQGAAPVADDQLPGESAALYFPEGAQPDVVGVEASDVLVVRALPDPGADEVGEVDRTGTVTTTGRERAVESGLWAEVEQGSGVGWVNSSYLGYLGEATDTTGEYAEVLPEIANPREVVGTIGQHAAERHTAIGGALDAWTVVDQPGETGPTEALIDVLGYPDDAQRGERLRVFFDEGDAGTAVSRIESSAICGRGVTDDGLCL